MLLQQTNHALSLLVNLFRLFYTTILAYSVSFLIQINISAASQTIELPEKNFKLIWSFGLIQFGIHLILVGFFSLKVIFIPKVLTYLIILAGISYCLVHSFDFGDLAVESVAILVENVLTLSVIIGELVLGLWLLFKGRDRRFLIRLSDSAVIPK